MGGPIFLLEQYGHFFHPYNIVLLFCIDFFPLFFFSFQDFLSVWLLPNVFVHVLFHPKYPCHHPVESNVPPFTYSTVHASVSGEWLWLVQWNVVICFDECSMTVCFYTLVGDTLMSPECPHLSCYVPDLHFSRRYTHVPWMSSLLLLCPWFTL